MNRTRIAIIGTMGLPAKYGGFETFVQFLVQHLGEAFDFTVYCSGPDYAKRPTRYLGARLIYLPLKANGPQSLAFDALGFFHGCFTSDVLLVLGSSGGFLYPLARLLRRKVILNQGGLDWQRSKWGPRTQKLLKFLERSSVTAADVLVSDNQGIADYFKAAYGRDSVLIEYGGDQIVHHPLTPEFTARYPFTTAPYAFSVARIQPDNNVEMILEGFTRHAGLPLVFVGNWAGSPFGREIKARYEGRTGLHLLEAIYAPDILDRLRGNCALYVHGHSAGGTNPSLVEAMHLGLPIAAYDVVYNRATTEGKALYFQDAEGLAELCRKHGTSDLEAMRKAMAEIAARRYQWRTITSKYAALF